MTVRIGLVGAGFMARTHLEAFATVPGAEVVTVVSRNEERGRELAVADVFTSHAWAAARGTLPLLVLGGLL